MAKARTQFICNSCGSMSPKWMGKCTDCGTWDSLEEYKAPTVDKHHDNRATAIADFVNGAEALRLDEIDTDKIARLPTGIAEFDRILGGGIVPGSATLVGGEPGIGKSTLLLQVAGKMGLGPWGSGLGQNAPPRVGNANRLVFRPRPNPQGPRPLPFPSSTSPARNPPARRNCGRIGCR